MNERNFILVLAFLVIFIFLYRGGYIGSFFQGYSPIRIAYLNCNDNLTICYGTGNVRLSFDDLIRSGYTLETYGIYRLPIIKKMSDDYAFSNISDSIDYGSANIELINVNYCKPTEFSYTNYYVCYNGEPATLDVTEYEKYNDTNGCQHIVYRYKLACISEPEWTCKYIWGCGYYCSCCLYYEDGNPVYCKYYVTTQTYPVFRRIYHSCSCQDKETDIGGLVDENKPKFTYILNNTEAYKKYGLNYSLKWDVDNLVYRMRVYYDKNINYLNETFVKDRHCYFNASINGVNVTAIGNIRLDITPVRTVNVQCVLNESTFEPDISILSKIWDRNSIPVDNYSIKFDFRPDTDGDGIVDDEDVCPNESGIELLKGCPPNDFDHDGMPDEWEIENGLNPLEDDSMKDKDGDGLPNINEYEMNTSVTNPDTDDDGLEDGYEYKIGTNPKTADTDGDGISDSIDKCPLEPGKQEYQGCVPWYEKYWIYIVGLFIILISIIIYVKYMRK